MREPAELVARWCDACRSPATQASSAERTPALLTRPLGPLFTHTVPREQISESVCLDLGIIAGASVSVQRRFCDPGRDMTLMFDEACCWWICCSCRPLACVCCLLRCEPVQCHLQHDWHMLLLRPRGCNNSMFAEGQH